EEDVAVPPRSGDSPRDCRQRFVGPPLVLKVFGANRDVMLASLPFPDEAGAQHRAVHEPLADRLAIDFVSERVETFERFRRKSAIGKLLHTISEPMLEEAPVVRGRFILEEVPP